MNETSKQCRRVDEFLPGFRSLRAMLSGFDIAHNPANERIKGGTSWYLREAGRQSEASVDAAAKALSRFEALTGYRDFKTFHIEQAVAFKRRLSGNGEGRG